MKLSIDIRKQRFSNNSIDQAISFMLGQNIGPPLSTDFPVGVTTANSFAWSYLRSQVFSKYDDGSKNPAKETKTWERFYEAESLCKETNARFSKPIHDDSTKGYSIVSILFSAKHMIDKILGKMDLNEVADRMSFGPGATTRLSRRERFGGYKFSGQPEVTQNCVHLAAAAIASAPTWALEVSGFTDVTSVARALTVVNSNKVIKVPKSYKTDRTIAKEPCMNIYVQKGFGSVIRSRLSRVGVDLLDQTVNQELAKEGSITGALATVDLSMASDCLSTGLVYHLLPPVWFDALEQCRSRFGKVISSDELICWEKFSSMGNGFTFELESLIFYVISKAVVESFKGEFERRVNVYGDDIVVPSYAADRLLEVLRFCGFLSNPDKTFSSGPFRESCGKHYYSGSDVTPFYIRRPIKDVEDLFLVHNNLMSWISRITDTGILSVGYMCCEDLRLLVKDVRWREPRLLVDHPVREGCFHGFEFEVNESSSVTVLSSRPRRRNKVAGQGFLLYSLSQGYGLVDAPFHSSLPSEERTRFMTKLRVKW